MEEIFKLGELFISRGVNEKVAGDKDFAKFVAECLRRHAKRDWGDLDEQDKKENELSLREGFRILSSYRYKDGKKIWIITEADRSMTTVLFPEEY